MMTFRYRIECDGCGKCVEDWDGVPAGWGEFRNGMHERQMHYCQECVAKIAKAIELSKRVEGE